MAAVVERFIQISKPPTQDADFNRWLEMGSAISFLSDNAQEQEFVVYASDAHSFVHTIAVPACSVVPPDIDDLMNWNFTPYSSWGITVHFSEPRSISISPPLTDTGSKILNRGEQLVFPRQFDGRPGNKSYHEILQRVTHIFDLHYIDERKAYCRLDGRGDLEDMIRIIEKPGKGENFDTDLVLFNRELLDQYLVLTESVLVRMFDFTRYRPGQFSGWGAGNDFQLSPNAHLHYRLHVEPGYASYARGIQIVQPRMTKEVLLKCYDPVSNEETASMPLSPRLTGRIT